MEDLDLFFSPVESFVSNCEYEDFQLGSSIDFYCENNFPNIDGVQIAIMGVPESRNSGHEIDSSLSPDLCRQYLYRLSNNFQNIKIADLGNLKIGNTYNDTYEAVSEIVCDLLKNNVVTIIIGGTQDLTYANYLAYEKFGRIINILSIDSRLDIGKPNDEFNSETWLNKIILRDPNFLFNYTNMGYQNYFVDSQAVTLIKKMYFDAIRLGVARSDIAEMEPIIRNSDMVSLDISAIRQSDSPFSSFPSPNGFSGEEVCQLAKYSGMNEKTTSFGIYEIAPNLDKQGQSTHLAAHIIWHFIEGLANRKDDDPHKNKSSFIKYIVSMQESDTEMTFYRSPLSERWWMEVPCPVNLMSKFERHYMVPCSYKDYQLALKEIVPDRWWETYQKFM